MNANNFQLYPTKAVRSIDGCVQLIIIGKQKFSPDRERTFCFPLIYILLPNKKSESYTKMLRQVGVFYENEFCEKWSPQIMCDSEISMMSSIFLVFGKHPTNCFFHILQSWHRRMQKNKRGL